jgi:hypothetical protein
MLTQWSQNTNTARHQFCTDFREQSGFKAQLEKAETEEAQYSWWLLSSERKNGSYPKGHRFTQLCAIV